MHYGRNIKSKRNLEIKIRLYCSLKNHDVFIHEMSDLRPQSWMWRHMIVICLLMRFELKRNITEYTGFWGPSTSSVDWCESNYEMTEYMAEFNNSLSSFSMVLSGLLGLMMHPWAEKRFKLAFITTIICKH